MRLEFNPRALCYNLYCDTREEQDKMKQMLEKPLTAIDLKTIDNMIYADTDSIKTMKTKLNSEYGRMTMEAKENLNFGTALEAIKDGMKASRAGWNGKSQFIELATRISYVNMRNDHINIMHKDIGNNAIAFVGTRGIQLGWLASQADMLANDWYIFD